MQPPRARVDLGEMAMKGNSAFTKAPALLEVHHQIVLCHIQDNPKMQSVYSTVQLQLGNQNMYRSFSLVSLRWISLEISVMYIFVVFLSQLFPMVSLPWLVVTVIVCEPELEVSTLTGFRGSPMLAFKGPPVDHDPQTCSSVPTVT